MENHRPFRQVIFLKEPREAPFGNAFVPLTNCIEERTGREFFCFGHLSSIAKTGPF